MKDDESLSGKIYKIGATRVDVILSKDVKEAVQKLKEGCIICGKYIIQGGRGRPNKSGLCDKCRNDIACNGYYFKIGKIRESLNKRIDKIFGSKLTE